jgi:hypothetical protein
MSHETKSNNTYRVTDSTSGTSTGDLLKNLQFATIEPPYGGMSVMTKNGLIACSPFPAQHIEKVIKGGIALIESKVSLQELTVLFSGNNIAPGDKVYLRGDAVTNKWAKEQFTLGGQTFILVPESAVQITVRG